MSMSPEIQELWKQVKESQKEYVRSKRITHILEWVCMLGGVSGALSVALSFPQGYFLFLIGSTAGMAHAYRMNLTQLLILNLCFTVCNIIGLVGQVF